MIEEALRRLTGEVAEHALRCGRDPACIRILAVTKSHPRTVVDAAVDAGIVLFGENRVQEAVSKYEGLGDRVELHLIGHLQSNKARHVPGLFACVESVDSPAIAEALSRRCVRAGVRLSALLQLNSSDEETKSGYRDPEQLLQDAPAVAALPALELRGVMTIGPFGAGEQATRRAFERTREVFEQMKAAMPRERIDTLSMGMSDDYPTAIACGATELRIGSLLFGARG